MMENDVLFYICTIYILMRSNRLKFLFVLYAVFVDVFVVVDEWK